MGTMPFLMGLDENLPAESILTPTVAVPASDAMLAHQEADLLQKQGFDVVRVQQGQAALTYTFRGDECPTLEDLERALHAAAKQGELDQIFVVSDIDLELRKQPIPVQIQIVEFELALCESGCSEYLFFLPNGCYSEKSAPFDGDIEFMKEILRQYRAETKSQEEKGTDPLMKHKFHKEE